MATSSLDKETERALLNEGVSPRTLKRMPDTVPNDLPANTAGLPSLQRYYYPSSGNTGVAGFMINEAYNENVDPRTMSQALFLSPESKTPNNTVAHEAEHLLARQNLGDAVQLNSKFDELLGDKKSSTTRREFVKNAVAVAPYLEKKYGLKSAYFTKEMVDYQGSRARNLLYEQLATLSAIEQTQGVDLTKDPELRKTLFKDPAVRETYNALTGLRQTRLDAKDLPPHTRQPEKKEPKEPGMIDKLKRLIGYAEGGYVDNAGNRKLI